MIGGGGPHDTVTVTLTLTVTEETDRWTRRVQTWGRIPI